MTLPLQHEAPLPRVMHPIPDVRGLDLRDAVRSLHSAGFRVQLAQSGGTASSGRGAAATSPAQGELVAAGSVVRLVIDY